MRYLILASLVDIVAIGCRDITYIPASGSIVAASGYGSDGFNAVIWDTLAPPSTSRASIKCHEGFDASLRVLPNL